MNEQESKALVERLGGLNAIQNILDEAPRGTHFVAVLDPHESINETHFFSEREGRVFTDGFECWCDSGYSDINDLLKLEYEGFTLYSIEEIKEALKQNQTKKITPAGRYDWIEIPKNIQLMATDCNGYRTLWTKEPEPINGYWRGEKGTCKGEIWPKNASRIETPNWRESLEQRPNPCATCPHSDDVCCGGVR